jgi:tetratricopeptide (TPR) repeat protein
MFGSIIGAERAEAEPTAVREVIELCSGLPLALRIAGSRLLARPSWNVQDLADRLADAAVRLDELATGDLRVRASFAVSYGSLPPAAGDGVGPARAFRLLGLGFGPDIGVEAAAALLCVEPKQAERALETLLDSHLLQAGSAAGRYGFHDLLRIYATERACAQDSAADRDAALDRLLAWYVGSAINADHALLPGGRAVPTPSPVEGARPREFADGDEALCWLRTELPNLLAAVNRAARREDHQTTWRLSAALCTFLMRQSLWDDWISVETTGLASARRVGDLFGQGWLLNSLAVAHWQTGHLVRAARLLDESLRIRRSIGDEVGVVLTLANLGFLHLETKAYERAVSTLEQALVVNGRLGQPHVALAEILNCLGEANLALGRFDRAHAPLQQSLTVSRYYRNREWEGAALLNLATLASRTGRQLEAVDLYEQSLLTFRQAADRYQECTALIGYGHALDQLGKADEARHQWEWARHIMEQTSDPRLAELPLTSAESV